MSVSGNTTALVVVDVGIRMTDDFVAGAEVRHQSNLIGLCTAHAKKCFFRAEAFGDHSLKFKDGGVIAPNIVAYRAANHRI